MSLMSFAIFMSESAPTLSAEDTSAKQSVLCVVSIKFGDVSKRNPTRSESICGYSLRYSFSAFMPVPIAVPPMFIFCNAPRDLVSRQINLRVADAYAFISCPNVIGTAS